MSPANDNRQGDPFFAPPDDGRPERLIAYLLVAFAAGFVGFVIGAATVAGFS